jgi:uncharacterized membrane protein YedE/YeeE
MYLVASIVSGLVFGLGLIISGMVNPAKVLGFLDMSGKWDPSLALVMGGAVMVGLVAFHFAGHRARSVLGAPMPGPARQDFDLRTLLGSLAFGVGWGMAGFCPGPALVALGAGMSKAFVFVAAMFAGMALFELIERTRAARSGRRERSTGQAGRGE